METETLLTEREAAEALDVRPCTLRTYRAKGLGPEFERRYGRILYSSQAITEYRRHRVRVRRGKRGPRKPKPENGAE